ncbi:MAG: response regulator [bacterium]|nr:response regulator [bacterium]
MKTTAQKIDGFSLENILQIFSLERKSQSLQVTKEDQVGMLDIDQGELIHAQLDKLSGMDAAMEILAWDDVLIEVLPPRAVEPSINSSLINILLEVSKLKDERKSAREESGEDLLQSAIEKAERQQYKQAHEELTAFLKKRKDSVLGWIWFARIQGNVEIIQKSLSMAANIDATDPLLQEEQRKLALALPQLRSGAARKCYFCWTPLDKNAASCLNCKGHLAISIASLSHIGEMDEEVAGQALERYQRILKKYPRSLTAVYCLSLIKMNRGNLKEALVYLDKAAKMAPERALFTSQLNLLLDHLARSSQGKGSDTGAAEPELPVETEDASVSGQKIILVVEDSATTRKVIAITLTRNGYRVIEAGDGLEALSKISEERPDLIMLDVILPKMDGYKILSIIKANEEFKDIPVIMLTSKDGFINKMKGRMAGSSAYLTKPFDPEKMILEIERHI